MYHLICNRGYSTKGGFVLGSTLWFHTDVALRIIINLTSVSHCAEACFPYATTTNFKVEVNRAAHKFGHGFVEVRHSRDSLTFVTRDGFI